MKKIGLIGEYRAGVRAHQGISKSIALASGGVEGVWLATRGLETRPLEEFDGLWSVPNTPYESMAGALRAIQYARERGVPFLGTCGGFQHAVIEYARNVLGIATADHAESNPETQTPLVTRLSCPLVEKRGRIRLREGSRAAALIGPETEEEYHCNFGLNAEYAHLFDGVITGWDEAGEPRVMEIPSHPYYVCTLFQPERAAFAGVAHPLVRAFVEAVWGRHSCLQPPFTRHSPSVG